jgi:hypothetical protein
MPGTANTKRSTRRSDLHRRFIETDCWLQLEATETRRLEGAKSPAS